MKARDVALGIVTVVAGVVLLLSCWPVPGIAQLPSAGVPLRPLPALDLPRADTSASPAEFAWGPGVLEAAQMYMPEDMMIYEVVHSVPTRDTACELAARLGSPVAAELRALYPESGQEEGWYYMTVGGLYLECFADGNFMATRGDREPYVGRPAREAVGVDEAIAAADRFLAETDLLPEGARLVEVVGVMLGSRYNKATGREERHVWTRGAVYRRFRDGFPEGKFVVQVNCDAQVCGVTRKMRDVSLVGRYPILSPEQARAALHSAAARIEELSPRATYQTAVIEALEMEYWDGALAWVMDSIQPIYKFRGTALGDDGRSVPFSAMVPAVRPEYLQPVALPVP